MKQSTFEFRDGKIIAVSFDDKAIKELMEGPYILKVESELVPLYYAGSDDATWEYLRGTGRLALSFGELFGYAWLHLKEKHIDVVKGYSWKILKTVLEINKNLHPDVIENQNSKESSPREAEPVTVDARAAKFNSMLT